MEWPTRECGNTASVLACNLRPPCLYVFFLSALSQNHSFAIINKVIPQTKMFDKN
jgi:hypothetical protein